MNTYYDPEDLAKFATMGEEAPKLWESFMNYYGQACKDTEKATLNSMREVENAANMFYYTEE